MPETIWRSRGKHPSRPLLDLHYCHGLATRKHALDLYQTQNKVDMVSSQSVTCRSSALPYIPWKVRMIANGSRPSLKDYPQPWTIECYTRPNFRTTCHPKDRSDYSSFHTYPGCWLVYPGRLLSQRSTLDGSAEYTASMSVDNMSAFFWPSPSVPPGTGLVTFSFCTCHSVHYMWRAHTNF